MKYRTMGRTGVRVSALGYGCMRYPKKGGRVDEERTRRQILSLIDGGVNYLDTAYVYGMGQSESILGRVLQEGGRREKVHVADKVPPQLVFSRADMDKILSTMLQRLRSDRVDFLLAHALSDFATWARLRSLGYPEFLEQARREGRIRFAGFSWHGNTAEFKKVVDDYPWDFCQIQYNYLDEHNQAGKEGLEYAASRGLGVAVMEPLRGGALVGRMPREVAEILEGAGVRRSPAAWALDWIWDHPGVSTVLSGLNEESHVAENLRLADGSEAGMFADGDRRVVERVREAYGRLLRTGCTGCGYCMPCPFGVDIPRTFAMQNTLHLFQERQARVQYTLHATGMAGGVPSKASLCRECGKCETHCPQHIPIRERLKEADRELTVKAMLPAARLLRFIMRKRDRKAAAEVR